MSSDEESMSGQSYEEEVVAPVKKRRKTKKKKKDPLKPKRGMSAFFLYSNANRARIKAHNPEAKFGDIARLLTAEFKSLPDRQAQKWHKLAEKDKLRYQNEMKHYVPPEEDSSDDDDGKRRKKKKDPNAPKRSMSAFFHFSNANRNRIKAHNPEAKFGDIAKLLSYEFKQLSARELARWQKAAEKDKVRYLEQMKHYVPPEDSDSDDGKRRKKKKKKDPNAPKRAMSAFFHFSNANRVRIKAQHPDAKFGDIAKLLSVQYKQLSNSQRTKYDKQALKDKERYAREIAAYKAGH